MNQHRRNEFIPIAILGLILVGLIALGADGLPWPLLGLRILLGLTFVLFVPGYALQAALFPRDADLDGPERLALSFGLSVASIPPLALILDWLPWGIRLWPMVISLGLLILIGAAVALQRRRRLPEAERFIPHVDVDVPGRWASLDRTSRILYGVVVGCVLMASVSAAAIIFLPKPGDYFTEFYILGSEGLAESYPREVVAGQQLSVTMGIANREDVPAEYRVEVLNGPHLAGADGPIRLEPDAIDERPIVFTPVEVGDDVEIAFLLYRDGGAEPYRRLRLWLKVRPP